MAMNYEAISSAYVVPGCANYGKHDVLEAKEGGAGRQKHRDCTNWANLGDHMSIATVQAQESYNVTATLIFSFVKSTRET